MPKSRSLIPDSHLAIRIQNVSMAYKLYNHPKDRVREALHPLRKKYHKDFYALKDINLEVRKGEILGVVGKNGSGKSTLLKIISRVLQPTRGTVHVNGNVSALLELGSGFNPEFTGIESIYFFGLSNGFSRKEMEKKIDEIRNFADIGEFIHQPVKTYSSGMRARLAFAVSTAIDPEILILDEVLAVGDELFRRKCFARMEGIMRGGKTILFVSHSLDSINQLCTRAVLLDRGELILEGRPKVVTMNYQNYLFVRPGAAGRVRREIVQLSKVVYKKKDGVVNLGGPDDEGDSIQKEESGEREVQEVPVQRAVYLNGFKSKSMLVQKNEGVDIYDIYISCIDDRKVNNLVTNEKYKLNYKVRFNMDVEDVIFSFAFKNERGIKMSGARYPGRNDPIKKISKNEEYHIKWEFRCQLLDGRYYLDLGVVKTADGDHKVISAIYDALVFKVQKMQYKGNGIEYTYIFNMDQRVEIDQVKNGKGLKLR